jgi:hypothetical protein
VATTSLQRKKEEQPGKAPPANPQGQNASSVIAVVVRRSYMVVDFAAIWMQIVKLAMAGEQKVNKKSGSQKQVIQF